MTEGKMEPARPLYARLVSALSAAVGVVSGLAPHVLHHVGPLAGAALFAGLGGTLLFGALGLAVSLPFLIQLYRRFGSLAAPGIALAVFAVGFSVSTFVLGPAVQSALTSPGPAVTESAPQGGGKGGEAGDSGEEHEEHHP